MRIYDPHELQHRLLYAANSREVVAENLERFLPNLQRRLLDSDDGRPFVYLGFIEGSYLDNNVNSERTNFTFLANRSSDALFDDPTLESIRAPAIELVSNDLASFIEEINSEKLAAISAYVTETAPEYRPLLRYVPEFIDRIAPGTSGRALEVALHAELYEKQRQLKQESTDLIQEVGKESLRPEDYESRIGDFIERANELGKASLAQYVTHRRVILEFLEKSLETDLETGKYPLEDVIHRIIYPMRTTSADVPYEQQNLWIIDERLCYHGFLASDMALDRLDALGNSSAARPDILIFDRALSFSEEGDGVLNSLVIVEFKRPARSDYAKEDPVDQVYRMIREIKGGHFKDRTGREIKVHSERIPAYAYVICDTTKEIEIIAQNKAMLPTPDRLGYYGFNPNLSAYVEIISYAKLLADAKKRNRILFEKLHLPT